MVRLMKQTFMVGFSRILDTRQVEDFKRQIKRGKIIVSRFRGKLVKVVKDAVNRFDDYSVSPKIRQILLHQGYELTEQDFFTNSTN